MNFRFVSNFPPTLWLLPCLLVLCSCIGTRQTPQQRHDAAKILFEATTKNFLLPSAQASGAQQIQLQDLAIAGYRDVLKKYADQAEWGAQALRTLGNIYATRTNLNTAVKYYSAVPRKYPAQDWEILMAWKSAADLLWTHDQPEEARQFYSKIVDRFDRPDAPQIVATVVRGSRSRLRPGVSPSQE